VRPARRIDRRRTINAESSQLAYALQRCRRGSLMHAGVALTRVASHENVCEGGFATSRAKFHDKHLCSVAFDAKTAGDASYFLNYIAVGCHMVAIRTRCTSHSSPVRMPLATNPCVFSYASAVRLSCRGVVLTCTSAPSQTKTRQSVPQRSQTGQHMIYECAAIVSRPSLRAGI
jgi:hypothetical protein